MVYFKHLLIFIFSLCYTLGYTQNQEEDYKIYSEVFNNTFDHYFEYPDSLRTFLLIKKFKDKYNNDLGFLTEIGSLEDNPPEFKQTILYWIFKGDAVFIKRFNDDPDIKNVLSEFVNNFKDHPKIEPKLLKINDEKISLKEISSNKYYSLFDGKSDFNASWAKMENKYGTHIDIVMQFSVIRYYKSFAAVYFTYNCGSLCASGDVYLLEKENNDWKVIKVINCWMS